MDLLVKLRNSFEQTIGDLSKSSDLQDKEESLHLISNTWPNFQYMEKNYILNIYFTKL